MYEGNWIQVQGFGLVWAGMWLRHLQFLKFPGDSTIWQRWDPPGYECCTLDHHLQEFWFTWSGWSLCMGTPKTPPGDSVVEVSREELTWTLLLCYWVLRELNNVVSRFASLPEKVGVLESVRSRNWRGTNGFCHSALLDSLTGTL